MPVEDDLWSISFFFWCVRMRILPTFVPHACLPYPMSFRNNLRWSPFIWLSEGLYDRCWQRTITICWSHGNGWCCCCHNWCGRPQQPKYLIHYFSLSNNEKESSSYVIWSGIPLPLGMGRERMVPVIGAGVVGSADEADTGVKFVITKYKCKFINRIHVPLSNYSAHRRTLPCPIQPNFFCPVS